MRHKLTDRYIQTVKPPGSGRLVVADTEVTGLTLRVTPNGSRSFVVRYRPPTAASEELHGPRCLPDGDCWPTPGNARVTSSLRPSAVLI